MGIVDYQSIIIHSEFLIQTTPLKWLELIPKTS